MAIGTYGRGAQRSGHEGTTDSEVPSLASGEVKDKRESWYSKLSEKERIELNLKRLKKRKDTVGKQMYKAYLAKAQGKQSRGNRAMAAVYRARTKARKLGLPLPPLPSENAA
jgi:hypothetical protein